MKNLIAVNISASSFLEVARYNGQSGQIEDYIKEDINYDTSVRKIADYEELKETVRAIFAQMGLNGKQDVVVCLPTIFLNHTDLPSSLDSESLLTALASEAESNYLFSNSEPKVSYQEISEDEDEHSKNIVFTAYHAEEIAQIQALFAELGHNIVAIDSSYSSFIRTVISTGRIDTASSTFPIYKWLLLSVRGNSFVTFIFTGDKLLDLVEKPLATRSATQDELYESICSTLNDLVDEQMPDKVIVSSNIDNISAEVIAGKVSSADDIDFLEFNKFSQMPLVNVSHNVPPSIAPLITPEVNGVAAILASEFPLKFDYIAGVMGATEKKQSSSVDLEMIKPYLKPALVLVLAIDVLCIGAFKIMSGMAKKELMGLKSTKSSLEKGVKSTTIIEKVEIDPTKDIVEAVEKKNKKLVKSYNSLALNIPKKLWITKAVVRHDLSGLVEGKSFRMEDIAQYYRSLKSTAKFENLRINTLRVDGESNSSASTNGFSSGVSLQVEGSSLPKVPTKNSKKQKTYYFYFNS